jgi:osmoprotectant transport system substrate-binding protein
MKLRFGQLIGIGALLLAVLAAGCGLSGTTTPPATVSNGHTLTVASFNFGESSILANIYGRALKHAGYSIVYKLNLGNREAVEPAMERRAVDLYPGYAASELEFVDGGRGEASSDVNATLSKLNGYLAPRGLRALQPAPAVNTNGFAVTRATANRYNLRRISDLQPVAGTLTLGGPPECPSRPYCQLGLQRTYGLNFKGFRALDAAGPLTVAALEKGDVDVALIFTSDGTIAAKDLVVLQDDKHLQNADNVVPIVRSSPLDNRAVSVLDSVSDRLTTDALIQLNLSAQLDRTDPDVLAQQWLAANGIA